MQGYVGVPVLLQRASSIRIGSQRLIVQYYGEWRSNILSSAAWPINQEQDTMMDIDKDIYHIKGRNFNRSAWMSDDKHQVEIINKTVTLSARKKVSENLGRPACETS